MTAYYNEIDPYAAQWLRNLIDAGHIAPGIVDTRSIEDVIPNELREFTQCHFFAGVGVWSLALRNAGWPDDRPVWTGSCPCQPFSSAGQGGGFADERHLWPAFFHLIEQCRPPVVFGEQVASRDANPWLDLVQDDLEGVGYGVGAVPFPSASIGAPHIRDRLYWMAYANQGRRGRRPLDGQRQRDRPAPGWVENSGDVTWGSAVCRMDHADDAGLEGFGGGHKTEGGRFGEVRPVTPARFACRVEYATGDGREQRSSRKPGVCNEHEAAGRQQGAAAPSRLRIGSQRPGPTNGLWANADWLLCRDGKWRPVEPGTFPLAHGATARVGRLRAYGNAINAEAARIFIEAAMSCIP